MIKNIPIYSSGDLVECIEAKDQSLYIKKTFVGKLGLILKRLTRDEYVFVLNHMYISRNGEYNTSTFDSTEEAIFRDNAYKQYTYYPVVK